MAAATAMTIKKMAEYVENEIKLKLLRTDSGAWKFSYLPFQLRDCDLRGLYNGATPVTPTKLAYAEHTLIRFNKAHPGHLKVLTDLAAVYYRKKNLHKSFACASEAVQTGLECLKSVGFSSKRDKIDGRSPENQPFLLAFLFAGAIKMESGDMEGSVNFFERALQIDPDDHCKARGFAMNAYLHLQKTDKAFKIWEKYSCPDDRLIEILYGLPIIHLKQGKPAEAELAVKRAVSSDPKPAIQLLRVHNSEAACPQRSLYPSIKKAAAHYRQLMRKIWIETDGAMALLKRHTF